MTNIIRGSLTTGVSATGVVRGDVNEADLGKVAITEPDDLDVNPERKDVSEDRRILLPEEAGGATHSVDEEHLRARVRGWLSIESNWNPWWCCADTPSGKLITADYNLVPPIVKQEFARNVMRHLNKTIANNGAWITAWLYNGRRFYMLWKDHDGDIQIPIECDRPFFITRHWSLDDWQKHAVAAIGVWSEWHKNLDANKGQQRKVAQGEGVSRRHIEIGDRLST